LLSRGKDGAHIAAASQSNFENKEESLLSDAPHTFWIAALPLKNQCADNILGAKRQRIENPLYLAFLIGVA